MINRFGTLLVLMGFSAIASAQVCTLATGHQMPLNSGYFYGPNVAAAVAGNPAIATSIELGRDAWDITDAIDRIGNYNGAVTANDCPADAQAAAGVAQFQMGAFNFITGPVCATNTAFGITVANGRANTTVAYVDWWLAGCAICNTKSVTVNTAFAIVANGAPMANQIDLRSLMAHEFGHVLGMTHSIGGTCNIAGTDSCATNPNKETMYPFIAGGDTCPLNLQFGDTASADSYY
jgi:hypothetical protein